jgi:hypothetical protein
MLASLSSYEDRLDFFLIYVFRKSCMRQSFFNLSKSKLNIKLSKFIISSSQINSFKKNQSHFRIIRKLKIEELPAIWISDQDETQFRMKFWIRPADRKRWGSTFRFQETRDVWSRIFLCIYLKLLSLSRICPKALHCVEGGNAYEFMRFLTASVFKSYEATRSAIVMLVFYLFVILRHDLSACAMKCLSRRSLSEGGSSWSHELRAAA